LDYQRAGNNAPSVITAITAKLPIYSSDIYYRDRIGNISTSTCRPSRDGKTLEVDIQPRFPLFGGWKIEFYIGYVVPIQKVLSYNGKKKYKLNYKFGTPFDNTIIMDYTLKVILPEGSSDITHNIPFEVDSIQHENLKTFLDVTGRNVLVIKKKNVVDEQSNLDFQVDYQFPLIDQLRKPLWVVGFIFILCLTFIISVRVDLTIVTGKQTFKQQQELKVKEILEKFIEKNSDLEDLLDNLMNYPPEDFTSAESKKNELENNIEQILSELKDTPAEQYNKTKLIQSKEKAKYDLVKKYVSLAKSSSNNPSNEKSLSAIYENFDNLTKEIFSEVEEIKMFLV